MDSIDYLINLRGENPNAFQYFIRVRTKSCNEGVEYGRRWQTSTRWPDGEFAQRASNGSPCFTHLEISISRPNCL